MQHVLHKTFNTSATFIRQVISTWLSQSKMCHVGCSFERACTKYLLQHVKIQLGGLCTLSSSLFLFTEITE